jgi:hypothetical protein
LSEQFSKLGYPNVHGPSFSFSNNPDPPFPQESMKLLTNTVVEALRYVPLPELQELTLAFPITYEFGRIFSDHLTRSRIPIDHILQRLRHLSVQICEEAVDNDTTLPTIGGKIQFSKHNLRLSVI